MKLTFLTTAALFVASFAAVIKDPSSLGPLSPDKHPSTSLEESIRRMRLSIDRELLYLARAEEMKQTMDTDGMVARQLYPADEETDSTFGGFTDKVNDGTDLFRPIRPGVKVPPANVFEESPEPETSEVPPEPTESEPPVVGTPEASGEPSIPSKPGPDGPDPESSESPVEPESTPTPDEATGSPATSPGTEVPPSSEGIPPGSLPIPNIGDDDDSLEPSISPEELPDEESVCFPSDATVELEDGRIKTMSAIALGDRVLVGNGQYSEVFMFTHKMASLRHSFVELLTSSGHRLALTKSHYLYVNNKLAAASTVRNGDTLVLGNGAVTTVQTVRSIMSTGLYNPQTRQGDIIVNGVRASTYTLSVEPKMAHALLAPLRAVYDGIGFSLSAFEMGADHLASLVPSGSLVN